MKQFQKIESFTSRDALYHRKYRETQVKSPYLIVLKDTDFDFASEKFVVHKAYRKKTGWEISLKESGAVIDIKYSGISRHVALEKLFEFLQPMSKTSIDNLNKAALNNIKHWELTSV